MVASLEKSLAKQVERGKLEQADADAVRARVSATDHLGRAGRQRPGDRVRRRGPGRQAGAVRRARLDREGRRHPGDQHLDPAGGGDGRGHPRPDRVVGVHFFNPAPAMSLVEIIAPLTASDETVAEAKAFAEACGKNAVEVKDRAGFIVNALLFPYLNNAVRMLEAGTASAEDIDTAMKGGCNFPMGRRWPCWTWSAWTRRWRSSMRSTRCSRTRNYAAVPVLRRMVSRASWAASRAAASTTTRRSSQRNGRGTHHGGRPAGRPPVRVRGRDRVGPTNPSTCRSNRRRELVDLPRVRSAPIPMGRSRSAVTWNPAHCWRLTAAGCSRCPWAAARPTRLVVAGSTWVCCRSTASTAPDHVPAPCATSRCGRTRRSSRWCAPAATPAVRTAGSRRGSSRPTPAARPWAGPTAWRRGATASWSAGTTACRSGRSSPVSRCFPPRHRRLEGGGRGHRRTARRVPRWPLRRALVHVAPGQPGVVEVTRAASTWTAWRRRARTGAGRVRRVIAAGGQIHPIR